MNWRSPLWLSVVGAALALALVLLAATRSRSFDLDLVDEYTGGDEDGADGEE